MKDTINFKRTVDLDFETAVDRLISALKDAGFGVLTRIDLNVKIKEKIGKDIPQTTILGACNPTLAYEAFLANPDVTSLLPCNAVVRAIATGKVSLELAKPSAMMRILNDKKLESLATKADDALEHALHSF